VRNNPGIFFKNKFGDGVQGREKRAGIRNRVFSFSFLFKKNFNKFLVV
jgi:hypothetical protein